MLLSHPALMAVIAEIVTRDGTDDSDVEPRLEAVKQQLDSGSVELHFDRGSRSCNIVAVK